MNPTISICLITYQNEKTIAEAIDSIFKQTHPWDELVISDDGSTDETLNVVENELAKRDTSNKRIEIITSAVNTGLASNLNRAITRIKGDLIFAAAGDDVSEPKRVERVVAVWEEQERRPVMFHSDATIIDGAGNLVGRLLTNSDMTRFHRDNETGKNLEVTMAKSGDDLLRNSILGARIIGATQAWTRKLFEVFGPLNDDLMIEDEAMSVRAATLGEIVHVSECLVRYRVGGISSWDSVNLPPNEARKSLAKKARMKQGLYRQKIRDLEKANIPVDFLQLAKRELSRWELIEASATRSVKTIGKLMDAVKSGLDIKPSVIEVIRSAFPLLTNLKKRCF